jgi:elongation factor P
MDDETLGDNAPWMQDNMMVIVEFYNGKPMSVQLPQFLNLTITDTAPVMKTATKTASSKPAVLENGVSINVPEFIATGERVRVNPNTGEYMDRAKD